MILMRKTIVAVALVLLTATAWAANITKYEKLDCKESGFTDAYLFTEIDPVGGCILAQWGVGCDGKSFRHEFTIQSRPSNLQMPFDYEYSGITMSGSVWYVRIDYEESGFVRAWGKRADGTYYEAILPE